MASLLQIASILAERAGKKNDITFIEEMKDLAVIKRGRFLANTLSKNPAMAKYYMSPPIVLDVEKVDRTDLCAEVNEDTENCDILYRSVETLPDPVKYAPNPFSYVGYVGGTKSFGWTTFGYDQFLSVNKYVGKRERAAFAGGYIYLFNFSGDRIQVQDVFPDPRVLAKYKCGNGTVCWKDELDGFLDEQTAQLIIQDILTVELRIVPRTEEKEEIKVDQNV